MLTKAFWKLATERAVKTFLQTLVPLLTPLVAGYTVFNWMPDWRLWLGAVVISGEAAGLSYLTSVASTLRGNPQSPSLVVEPPTVVIEPPTVVDEPSAGRHSRTG